MATVSEIREWMDKQIKARKVMNERIVIEKHDGGNGELVNFSHTDSVHISAEAVRYLSELFELDLCVKGRRDNEYPYEVFIIYKGEVFFGLESTDDYNERGAVV